MRSRRLLTYSGLLGLVMTLATVTFSPLCYYVAKDLCETPPEEAARTCAWFDFAPEFFESLRYALTVEFALGLVAICAVWSSARLLGAKPWATALPFTVAPGLVLAAAYVFVWNPVFWMLALAALILHLVVSGALAHRLFRHC